ncbi:methyl-accepting chemotaxis protein [Geosporobacter subterraneus DSM 17957]|uniref:Methyl-accepting chemotaxis protein n=1 Tax=Geosporobacter subterraneus DSM 17957 TaxID=1121919 RepID=A0A1M6ETY9_9FIRM|nr:methyl-accepting chemotaxis protein [Geosporobacter subterraneus]SHI88849.1 methyl-accepting chemotaxis protein [Geosporobacter subterraneus DSM 17957]
MKIKMNLMTKLMAYFLALIIIPVSVLGLYSYTSAEKALVEKAEALLLAVLEGGARDLTTEKKNIENLGSIFNSLPEIESYAIELGKGQVSENTVRLAQKTTAQFRKSIEIISEDILITNNQGKVVMDSTGGANAGMDLSGREYFRESMTGKALWSEVLQSKITGNPVIVHSIPLKTDTGDIVGIVAIAIKFEAFSKWVAMMKAGESGYGYLVDKNGLVLYHPVKDKILKENLLETAAGSLKEQVVHMTQGGKGSGLYTYNGENKLNMYMPVGNWSLAVNIPTEEYMKEVNSIKRSSLIVGLLSALIGAFVAFFAARQITNPIKHLMELMGKAEAGDLTVAAKVKAKDEIGDLAASFNHMIQGQREAMVQVLDAANQVGSAAQQASSISQEMSASAESQTASLEELTTAMNEMSSSIGQVAANISQMAGNVGSVSSAMEELGKSAEEVARSTEDTSATIVDVTTSIQQMNTSIEQAASNAHKASGEAKNTVLVAEEGKTAVGHTITEMDQINKAMANLTDAIKGLGKAAIQIGDIVEVIDDIAEQTNLLALNAAIEAARAGEHGKGFAVVAGAIGNLAEKSSDATKDITNLIKQIQEEVNNAIETTHSGAKQVENGVNLVKDTGTALDKIFVAIERTTKMINDIAASTDEQAKASKAIMDAVEKVNELSMQVSAAVEEQASSIQDVILSMEKMNSLAQEVAGAAEEQSASSEEILATTENVNEVASEVSAGSEEVASTAQNLASQANSLLAIVSKFKIV